MKELIKNLPEIPHKSIAEKSENYRVTFTCTEYQMDEIFPRYKVEYLRESVNSMDELIGKARPACPLNLIVNGVSCLVAVVDFETATPDKLTVISVGYWLLYDGQLLRPQHDRSNEPYRFFLVGSTEYDFRYRGEQRYFKYDVPAPQRIGKATEKKLRAWADWLNGKEAALAAYRQNTQNVYAEFFAKLDASGLPYTRNGNNVIVTNGCLKMKAELGEGKVYCARPEFDWSSDNKAYFARGVNSLDYMLNNVITVTPKGD